MLSNTLKPPVVLNALARLNSGTCNRKKKIRNIRSRIQRGSYENGAAAKFRLSVAMDRLMGNAARNDIDLAA